MSESIVHLHIEPLIATIMLNDPDRRNAMGLAMFDALDRAIEKIRSRDDVVVVLIAGNGPALCAGFDIPALAEDPALVERYILRLSALIRALRRQPQVVIAAAHGAAIAGGCALITACDFVVAERATKIGYPVHRIGLSPAVSAPTLMNAIGSGAARELMMSGRIISGEEALRLGLASHIADGVEATLQSAQQLCGLIAAHGSDALRVTKQWLNELDGSFDDPRYDGPAIDTGTEAMQPHNVALLREFWRNRSR